MNVHTSRSGRTVRVAAAIILSVILVLTSGTAGASAATTYTPNLTDNSNLGNYDPEMNHNNATPIYNHLVKVSEGYMRFSADDLAQKITIEYFDTSFKYIKQKTLKYQLPWYGGFHKGSDGYYYVVFGQSNGDQLDSAETYRIVKFNKDWTVADTASIRGANTSVPFAYGSLRAAEKDGKLYIRTCREMYMSGYARHQSNISFAVDMATMTVSECYDQMSNEGSGYVSHSENQFIIKDDNNQLVTLDHGDALPRAALIGKYSGGISSSFTGHRMMTFTGNGNKTYATFGSLASSGSYYMVSGASTDQKGGDIYDAYLYLVDKDLTSTKSIKLTSYTDDPLKHIKSAPRIIKFSSTRYCVIWATGDTGNAFDAADPKNDKVNFTFRNGKGTKLTSVKSVKGSMSDVDPIVVGDKAVWYVGFGDSLYFYTLSSDGVLKKIKPSYPKVTVTVKHNDGTSNSTAFKINKGWSVDSYGVNIVPKRKNYKCIDWYSGSEYGTYFRTSDILTKSITLYPNWSRVENPYTAGGSLKTTAKTSSSLTIRVLADSCGTGQQVQIATNSTFSAGKKNKYVTSYTYLTGTEWGYAYSTKFTGLTSGKKYYARSRTYETDSAGVKHYGKWGKTYTFTTK